MAVYSQSYVIQCIFMNDRFDFPDISSRYMLILGPLCLSCKCPALTTLKVFGEELTGLSSAHNDKPGYMCALPCHDKPIFLEPWPAPPGKLQTCGKPCMTRDKHYLFSTSQSSRLLSPITHQCLWNKRLRRKARALQDQLLPQTCLPLMRRL